MVQNVQSACPTCGKSIKIGQKFCTNCGTKFSEQSVLTTTSVAPTQLTITDKDWANVKQLIEQENRKKILNLLENHLLRLSHYDDASRKNVYDLINKIQTEDPQFFTQKIFRKLSKKKDKLLSSQQQIEMDKYILEKYNFFKGEELITFSEGKVIKDNITEIRGRFYVTNQRIIAYGQTRIKDFESSRRAPIGYGGMEFPYMHGIRIWGKLARIGGETDTVLPFGSSRNLIRVNQIKRKEKEIKFILEFEYEWKGKTKIKSFKLRVVPLKVMGENKIDFQKRREMVLSEINEVLNSYVGKM